MFLIIGRTIKEASRNFIRNGWLTVAAVSVMIMSLFIISVLYTVTMTASGILKGVENKVNVSVYFKPDTTENDIQKIKSDLEKYNEIKSVEYVSKDKALADFKANNVNEPRILDALNEIGDNPLPSSLVIQANSPSQYDSIVTYLGDASFKDEISHINYGKTKDVINRLNNIISEIKNAGLYISLLFAAISVLIIFNTVRITIYTHKQEVEVMRLVGASNMFIRLPFVFEGIFYGIVASVVSMGLLFAALKFASPYVTKIIPTEDLVSFYISNFLLLLGTQLAIGAVIGILSSLIAIRKYLKV
ncbi:MAG: ABC transporter permease [Candidatus Moranbacteria bacterium]|nr:ABC transporter permease [Candidatus Moranbacteria bacterium]